MPFPLSSLQRRRSLESDSGFLRRTARDLERNGDEATAGKVRVEAAKVRPRGIRSYDERIAEEDLAERQQRGLMHERRRLTLGGDGVNSTQSFMADVGRSKLVQSGDRGALSRAYERGAALGIGRDQIDSQIGRSSLAAAAANRTDSSTTVARHSPTGTVLDEIPGLNNVASESRRRGYREATDAITGAAAPFDPTVNSAEDIKTKQAEINARYDKRMAGTEPGNLAELKARDAGKTNAVGPLQQALNDAMARRSAVDLVQGPPEPPPAVGPPSPPSVMGPPEPPPAVGPPSPATPSSRPSLSSYRPALGDSNPQLNVKFSGPGGFTNPKVESELARQAEERRKREAMNAANMGKGSTQKPLLDRMLGKKPSWLEGSIAGSIYDAANK